MVAARAAAQRVGDARGIQPLADGLQGLLPVSVAHVRLLGSISVDHGRGCEFGVLNLARSFNGLPAFPLHDGKRFHKESVGKRLMRVGVEERAAAPLALAFLRDDQTAALHIGDHPETRVALIALNVLQDERLRPFPDLRILRAVFLRQLDRKIIEFLLLHAKIQRVYKLRAPVKLLRGFDRAPGERYFVAKEVLRPAARVIAKPQIQGPADQNAADVAKAVIAVDIHGNVKIDGVLCPFRCLQLGFFFQVIAVRHGCDPPLHNFHVSVELRVPFISVVAEFSHFFEGESGVGGVAGGGGLCGTASRKT